MYTKWLLSLLVYLLGLHSTSAIVCFIQDSVNYTANTGGSRMENMVAPRMTISSEEHSHCLIVHYYVTEESRASPGAAWILQPVAAKAHIDTENLPQNRCVLTGFTIDAPLYGAIVCSCSEDFCNRMDYGYELLYSDEFDDIRNLTLNAFNKGTSGIYDHNVDETVLECLARKNWSEYMINYKKQLLVATGLIHECYQRTGGIAVPNKYFTEQNTDVDEGLETPFVTFDSSGIAKLQTTIMTLAKSTEMPEFENATQDNIEEFEFDGFSDKTNTTFNKNIIVIFTTNVHNSNPSSQLLLYAVLPSLLVIIVILLIVICFVSNRKLREYREENEQDEDHNHVVNPHAFVWE